jgi:hypothetical protein
MSFYGVTYAPDAPSSYNNLDSPSQGLDQRLSIIEGLHPSEEELQSAFAVMQ